MRPGIRYCPRPSITLAPWGTWHSLAAPAQSTRSPRITVTAFRTGARPVPSHKVAPTMAVEGLTGGGGASLARGAPQAVARPASNGRTRESEVLMGSLLHLASSAERLPKAPRAARLWFKMRADRGLRR